MNDQRVQWERKKNVIYKCQSTERLMFMKLWILFGVDGWMDWWTWAMFLFLFCPLHLSIVIDIVLSESHDKNIKPANSHYKHNYRRSYSLWSVRMNFMYGPLVDVFEHYYFMNFLCTFWFMFMVECHTPYKIHTVTCKQYTLHWAIWIECDFVISFQVFFSNSVPNQVFAIKNKLNIMLSPP